MRRAGHVHPQRARLSTGGARRRVDLDIAHLVRLDHDHAVQPALEGGGAVARALSGDAVSAVGGEADGLRDVLGGRGHHDRGRVLVGGQVPRGARLVPRRVAGLHDPAGEAVTQCCKVLYTKCAHCRTPVVVPFPGRGWAGWCWLVCQSSCTGGALPVWLTPRVHMAATRSARYSVRWTSGASPMRRQRSSRWPLRWVRPAPRASCCWSCCAAWWTPPTHSGAR